MIFKWSLFIHILYLAHSCVMILITSNLDKVQSNILIVLCVSNTSEFQGVFANEFQFDENRILGVMHMIVVILV